MRRKPQPHDKMPSKPKNSAKKKAPPVAAATACSARGWTLLFLTKTGSTHPLRVTFREPVTQVRASQYAFEYLEQNDWLELLDDIYPTEQNDQVELLAPDQKS